MSTDAEQVVKLCSITFDPSLIQGQPRQRAKIELMQVLANIADRPIGTNIKEQQGVADY